MYVQHINHFKHIGKSNLIFIFWQRDNSKYPKRAVFPKVSRIDAKYIRNSGKKLSAHRKATISWETRAHHFIFYLPHILTQKGVCCTRIYMQARPPEIAFLPPHPPTASPILSSTFNPPAILVPCRLYLFTVAQSPFQANALIDSQSRIPYSSSLNKKKWSANQVCSALAHIFAMRIEADWIIALLFSVRRKCLRIIKKRVELPLLHNIKWCLPPSRGLILTVTVNCIFPSLRSFLTQSAGNSVSTWSNSRYTLECVE